MTWVAQSSGRNGDGGSVSEKKGNTRRETVWVGGAALEIKNSALTILKLVCALVIWVATGYMHLEFIYIVKPICIFWSAIWWYFELWKIERFYIYANV